jgi:hypothetical protein
MTTKNMESLSKIKKVINKLITETKTKMLHLPGVVQQCQLNGFQPDGDGAITHITC